MTKRTVDTFFELFITELKQNPNLQKYHRFINKPSLYHFRRAYYQQRLEYVFNNIKGNNSKTLDVGCGYGTTSIMLAYFGYPSVGTTLEYYFDEISHRLDYWKDYLDTSLLTFKYENILKAEYPDNEFDYIIAQDTLHHIEPINDAMAIFYRILKPGGKFIVSEENDKNIITSVKRFKMRGFNRVIEIYDEKLKEKFLLGNENTRSLKKWQQIFAGNHLPVDNNSLEYIRILPPSAFKNKSMTEVIARENEIWRYNKILRDYFFFGINFCAVKPL